MPEIKLKPDLYHLIRNDIPLREKIAAQLGVQVTTVYIYAVRNSPTLSKPVVINLLAKHTGKKEHEIIEVLENEQEGQNTRN